MSKKIYRRPKNVLPLETRIAVINDYGTLTKNACRLSKIYGCGRTQIQNIIKARKQLLALYKASTKHEKQSVVVSESSRTENVSEALARVLMEWYERSLAYNVQITEPMLENVAGHIAPLLGVESCRPQAGWVKSVMAKYNFSLTPLSLPSWEEASPPPPQQSLKSLKYTDIMDELGIKYTAVPPGFEFPNDSLSVCLTPILTGYESSKDELSVSIQSEVVKQERNEMESDRLEDTNEAEKHEILESPKEVNSYREALNVLGPLERFALVKGNVRAVGLINQLETLFRDELEKMLQAGAID